MPGRFERHARAKYDGWGSLPSRSGEIRQAADAGPDPARHRPARKNTRDWCKGKAGVPHIPMVAKSSSHGRQWGCGWRALWDTAAQEHAARWWCVHQEQCERCGKILVDQCRFPAERCPLRPGSAASRALAEARARWINERAATRPVLRRKVITGPQGYRRRRQGAGT